MPSATSLSSWWTRHTYWWSWWCRGEICPCRHCWRQCKIFAIGVNFSIFKHFSVFITETVQIRWNWRCKSFSQKIRLCKILDKSHVCGGAHDGQGILVVIFYMALVVKEKLPYELYHISLSLKKKNIARITNAVQVTLWLSVTNPHKSFSICQE